MVSIIKEKQIKKLQGLFFSGFTESSPLSPFQKCQKDVGDDDVFMVNKWSSCVVHILAFFYFLFQTLNLPQEAKDSRSSSDSSGKGTEHLHRITPITYISSKSLEPRQLTYDPIKGEKSKSKWKDIITHFLSFWIGSYFTLFKKL